MQLVDYVPQEGYLSVPLRLYDGLQLLVERFAITEKQAPVTFLVDTGSGSMWLGTTNNRK